MKYISPPKEKKNPCIIKVFNKREIKNFIENSKFFKLNSNHQRNRYKFFFLFKKGILITNNFEQRGEAFISTIVSSSNNIKRSKHVKAASTYGILRCNSDLFEP